MSFEGKTKPTDEMPLLGIDSTRSYGGTNDETPRQNYLMADDLTTSDVYIDPELDLGPIIGYAQEPLLPLSKACSPLSNMIYNLWFYVQLAIDGTPEKPADGLTIDESAAIRLYTIEWPRPHRSLYAQSYTQGSRS